MFDALLDDNFVVSTLVGDDFEVLDVHFTNDFDHFFAMMHIDLSEGSSLIS